MMLCQVQGELIAYIYIYIYRRKNSVTRAKQGHYHF